MDPDPNKRDAYKLIRITGLGLFIPVVMFAGPFGGYLVGEFLVERFHVPPTVTVIAIVLSSLVAIREVLRIVKLLVQASNG